MRRILATLSVLFGSCTLLIARSLGAQAATAPVSCEPLQRALDGSRNALKRATAELDRARAAVTDAEVTKSELERTERARAECVAESQSCKVTQQQLCAATGAFAEALSLGHVSSSGVDQCVAPQVKQELVKELSGWTHAGSVLAQLGAYSAGETDAAPGLGSSSGAKVEKLLARLLYPGSSSPLVYRRLLLEALKLIAPQSWNAIRNAPGGVDKWFSSDQPLEEGLIAEARGGLTTANSGSDEPAPLTTALHFVSAYELLARCSSATVTRDCRRAAELRQVLETSGPLVVRRRIQDVWAAECSTLSDAVTSQWFRDLPLAQLSAARVHAVALAVHAKLVTCFLRDSTADASLPAWVATKLPRTEALASRNLPLLHDIEVMWNPGSPIDRCALAVRAMQMLAAPSECSVPDNLRAQFQSFPSAAVTDVDNPFEFRACYQFARVLWLGESATIPNSFPAPPTVEDVVRTLRDAPRTNMRRLRAACDERAGSGQRFEAAVRALASVGQSFGENPAARPWNLDAGTLAPVERVRARRATMLRPWLSSLTTSGAACRTMEMSDARCRACKNLPESGYYDCALLADIRVDWARRTRSLVLQVAGLSALALLAHWWLLLRRAVRAHGVWREQAIDHLKNIGLEPQADGLRYLFPSRMGRLSVALPKSAAWEHWGSRAAIVRCRGPKIHDRDIDRVSATAHSLGADLAFLIHEENASVELSAVRAMLEWAARGATRAVQVLPIPRSRLEWARSPNDLLELAEESSLRNNPFEVRGRITSSTQFFGRERLVSGLLASTHSGRFLVVTGLRRFGKSSLTLEVARRLTGPSAYVDLAGFHHEIRFLSDPSEACDAILRFLCLKLIESAQALYPGRTLPITAPDGPMQAATLAVWFRNFFGAIAAAGNGKTPPVLLILDEIEQAIGATPDLNHALDVFAILVGRLRNSLPGTADEQGQRVGVLFCSAVHPLLWAPLGTLAHQSLVGSFETISVPSLPEEVAISMMRGLGSRQGIRFTDGAVQLLVEECHGVPLLVRRLGSAVLELYDVERARQGALGAVEIGVQGVRAAIEREETVGSPLRVWIESEIAEPTSPGGVVLRNLACHDFTSTTELRAIAAQAFQTQFENTGVVLSLAPEESLRRAQEAGAVVVRMLGSSGLLIACGDPTEPDGYELPDGIIRRVLKRNGAYPPN